ncbi:TRAF6 [Mytilus edulis]|uniref:TRAF6 n=1 Tax=Mytilus edulis TaxID=6550 RepID=A0A8S3UFA8_MYTED|nr:TRAF6 [Mytilus edulis]
MSGRPDDIDFEEEIDRKYICPICLAVLWDPVQTSCGHRFCKLCLGGLVRGSWRFGMSRCPVDKKFFSVTADLFEDNAFKREVLSLRVKCNNHNIGCNWKGELRDYQTHIGSCSYSQENCVYGCGTRVKRLEHDDHKQVCHQRPVNCEHCDEQIFYADLTKHQVLMCEHFPVQCTLCGQTGIKRKDISSHIDVNTGDCPQTIIPCKYASYGCQFQDKRRCMSDHYTADPDHHILLLVQHNASQDRKIAELTSQMEKLMSIAKNVVKNS